jgi:hypothetical protein
MQLLRKNIATFEVMVMVPVLSLAVGCGSSRDKGTSPGNRDAGSSASMTGGAGGGGMPGIAGTGGAQTGGRDDSSIGGSPGGISPDRDGGGSTGTTIVAADGLVNVLTHKYDNNRSGWNPYEKVLTPTNVRTVSFGKVFSRKVDAQVYAQPLIVAGLTIGGKTRNVLYTVTMKNTLYAFDADDAAASVELWKASLGPAVPKAMVCGCNDIQPEVGATATPVIDLASKTIYIAAKHLSNGLISHKLHAIDILSGMPKQGSPVEMTATMTASNGTMIVFNQMRQLARPALLLQNGIVYVSFASHGDVNPYYGWVLGHDAVTLQQIGVFNPMLNTMRGGVWQSGGGPVGDGENVYFATGNGMGTNPNSNPPELGQSLVKISRDLKLVDWAMCGAYANLDRVDADHGAAGPMLIPNTNTIIAAGKEGPVYVYDRTNLGKYRLDDTNIVQKFRGQGPDLINGQNFGGFVYSEGPKGKMACIMPANSKVLCFKYNGTTFDLTPVVVGSDVLSGGNFTSAFLVSTSNAGTNGIIWAYSSDNMNPNAQLVPGRLRAFNADTGVNIWDTNTNRLRDAPGTYANLTQPTVANGKLYVPGWAGSTPGDGGVGVGEILVYGLLAN